MGRPINTDFSVAAGPADTAFEVDLAQVEARAIDQRPDIRKARLKAKQAEFDLNRTKASALPEISLAFDYVGFYNFPVLPQAIATVGVVGTWEPLDWGRRKLEAKAKAQVLAQAKLASAESEDAVRLDVRERYRKIQEARAMLNVAGLAQQTAREKLRVATERYRLEATLYQQVLEAQTGLADADQRYRQALTAFWTARADFDVASGGGD
jgi:outer membrane protein TolC